MKYALGNMLNGAGGLNADQLALDLQFAADKTLTARKGPTPVFTRASSGTFVGSNGLIQSAGNGVARFDHDPVTLASRGLLIEESRTNIFQRSGEYENAYWDDVTGTTCAGVSSPLAPDGSSDAAELKETATTLAHSRGKNVITSVSGTAYTLSVFLKKNNRRYCGLYLLSVGPTTSFNAIFDLDTGTVSATATQGAANGSASIEAYGNGWYKCRVTFTAGSTLMYPGVFLSDRAAFTSPVTSFNIVQYTGDTNNSVYVWGAQLEAGSFPTSYIPTTTASVVRSADVCSITGAAFSGFYNQPEGTLFADVTPQAVAQLASPLSVNTTGINNAHGFFKSNSTVSGLGLRWAAYTTTVSQITTSTDVATSRSRLSYGYKINDFAFAYSGSIVGTDTSGSIPSPTAMRIGSRDDGFSINGHLAAVRYYRLRLSNAKLQSLTV